MNTPPSDSLKEPLFTLPVLIAALISFSLLPIALILGTNSQFFVVCSYIHYGSLLVAACYSLLYFAKLIVKSSVSPIWPLSLFIVFVVTALLSAAPPPTNPEALSGPLYAIKFWLKTGSMVPINWNADSYAPHLPSLSTAAMASAFGYIAIPIYSLAALVATCSTAALLTYKHCKSSLYATYSFLLCLSLPLLQQITIDYTVDVVMAMYGALSLLYLLNWTESDKPAKSSLALGIVLGALAATGFRGMGLTLIFVLLIPVSALSKNITTGKLFLAIFIIPTLTALGVFPWILRNFMWTMNPIFPILSGYIDTSGGGVSYQSIQPVLITDWMNKLGYSYLDLVFLPITYLLPGPEATSLLGSKLSPLLIFLFISLFKFKKRYIATTFVVVGLYFLISLVLFQPSIVALTPIAAILCYLTICGIDQASDWCKQYKKLATHILLGLHFVFSLYFSFELVNQIRPFAFLENRNVDSYLSEHITEYPLIGKLNTTLAPMQNEVFELTAYLIGTSPVFYYYDLDIRMDAGQSPSFLLEQLKLNQEADELMSAFLYRGLQIIVAKKDVLNSTIENLKSSKERSLWKSFVDQHLEKAFEDKSFVVWKITREKELIEPSITNEVEPVVPPAEGT